MDIAPSPQRQHWHGFFLILICIHHGRNGNYLFTYAAVGGSTYMFKSCITYNGLLGFVSIPMCSSISLRRALHQKPQETCENLPQVLHTIPAIYVEMCTLCQQFRYINYYFHSLSTHAECIYCELSYAIKSKQNLETHVKTKHEKVGAGIASSARKPLISYTCCTVICAPRMKLTNLDCKSRTVGIHTEQQPRRHQSDTQQKPRRSR